MAKAPVQLAPGLWRTLLIGDDVNGSMLPTTVRSLIDMGLASSDAEVMAALRAIGSDPAT